MLRTLVGRALTLAISISLLAGTVVLGQVDATPAATDSAATMLAPTLLTANDLPEGMTSQGITDGSAFTIDTGAFTASGGRAIAVQTWSAQAEGPVLRVFDFRFLFPSPEAAQAFLSAAGPTLSEAESGLSEVSGDIGIGDGYRHFAGEAAAGEQAVALQNVFFRIGPVVAKVFVGGLGTTWADALPIVKAAAGRIVNPSTDDGAGPTTPAPTTEPVVPSEGPTTLPNPDVTPEAAAEATPETTAEPTPKATAEPTTEATPEAGQSTVEPGVGIRQWAVAATASTNYGSGSQWAAQSATGEPDVTEYGDNQLAWVPKSKDGTIDWLDLRFDQAVIPTGVAIYESFSPGFVTKVEAYRAADAAWVTLWEGTDPTPPDALGVFTPSLEGTDVAVDRIRITIDTDIPDYNEIDAVELVGTPPN